MSKMNLKDYTKRLSMKRK